MSNIVIIFVTFNPLLLQRIFSQLTDNKNTLFFLHPLLRHLEPTNSCNNQFIVVTLQSKMYHYHRMIVNTNVLASTTEYFGLF